MHQVGAQVLSDVLMPGLSHSAGRERGGGGQVRQSASYRPVWHQLTGDEMKRATDVQSNIYKRMIKKIDIVGFKDELICQVSAILVFSHFSNCKTQHQEAG